MDTRQTPLQWTGMASIVAGIILPLYAILHPTGERAAAAAPEAWAMIHSLWFVGTALALAGLIGLYSLQWHLFGRAGNFGFLLALVGLALMLGVSFIDSFVVPVLAVRMPEMAEPQETLMATLPMMVAATLSYVLVAAGYILFGLGTIRVGVLPYRAVALLAVGGAIFPIGQALGPIAGGVSGLIFGAGLIWLGYILWSSVVVPRA